jgi:Zn-dependent metalloprotease
MNRFSILRLRLPLLLVLVALTTLPVGAAERPRAPRPDALEAYQSLQRQSRQPVDVRWDTATGVAARLVARGRDARLPYYAPPDVANDPTSTALGFLEANRALFGIRSAASELRLDQIEPDTQLGWYHVRLDQYFRGVPVWGRQLVVHLDEQLRVTSANGEFQPNIDIPVEPALSAADAADVALRNLTEQQLEPFERLNVKTNLLPDRTRLMIYVDQQGKATLTWYVTILTERPLGQWRFFVHAQRPLVVHAFDSLSNAKRRVTYTAGNSTRLPGRKLIDEGERSRDPVAQAAHDGAGIVYDYFFNNFQRDGIDGQGGAIVSTVNFGSSAEDAENAAWIGELQQMIYGDGGRIFRPLSLGLDVVAHELTHGITDNTSRLIYESQSGALNESYSDVFGTLIDDKNWTLGEEVVKSPPFPTPVLRSMEDPSLGGIYDPNNPLQGVGQPTTVAEYADLPISRRFDNGGVHINSGIPNHAAYLVAQAIGREKTGQIYYRTLTSYLTPSSDFLDAAQSSVQAATELFGDADAQAVRNAFTQVGIDPGGGDTVPTQTPEEGQTVPGQAGGGSAPPPVPAGCSDIVQNGGFESNGGWQEVTAGEYGIIDTELPNTGRRSAWLGGTDQEPLQYIYQELRIPPNATRVELRYYRLIHEETTGLLGALLAPEASFGSLFLNTRGDVLGAAEQYSSTQGDDTWRPAQIDVSELAGQVVRLAFAAENPRGNVSSFFVDDVQLVVCTAGTPPAAPRPNQAGAVYIQGTISDANTGRGVSGAQVFIINPGLSATRAASDGNITEDEVLTYGVSDQRGQYQTQQAIPIGQTYSVIVVGNGYRPVIADNGMQVPGDATNPFVVDATLRR